MGHLPLNSNTIICSLPDFSWLQKNHDLFCLSHRSEDWLFTRLESQPFGIACQDFLIDDPSRSNQEDLKCSARISFQLGMEVKVF
jgi:hypothetical protein